jgi:hypothetical protein
MIITPLLSGNHACFGKGPGLAPGEDWLVKNRLLDVGYSR